MMPYIPLDQCADRRVYRLFSRNLTVGVFNAKRRGFIGIREKLGHKYLFMEYHVDTGPPYGTVRPTSVLDMVLPAAIQVVESYEPTYCKYCGWLVRWTGPPAPAPWTHIDVDWQGCKDPTPESRQNRPLFGFLSEIEEGLHEEPNSA